ncbi:MAG TPA: hypothetical protein VGI03_04860 [Verrucomicrobiae bacterium]
MKGGKGSEAKHQKKNSNDQSDHEQNGPDDSADLPGFCIAAPGGIHRARVHLLEIVVAHQPRDNHQRAANDDPENTQNDDERAAMWFPRFFGLRLISFNNTHSIGNSFLK